MRHYEKIYNEAGVYIGLLRLGFAGRWICEDRQGNPRSFDYEDTARDWLARQVIRDRMVG